MTSLWKRFCCIILIILLAVYYSTLIELFGPVFTMNNVVKLMYITVPTREMGVTIAKALVQEKLAACVNIMNSEVESYYMWNGAVETGNEHILFVKTVKANVERVIVRTKELHSYDVPCVLSFDVDDGDAMFMNWIKDNTGASRALPTVDFHPSTDSTSTCSSATETK